jgi:hypothetical protein
VLPERLVSRHAKAAQGVLQRSMSTEGAGRHLAEPIKEPGRLDDPDRQGTLLHHRQSHALMPCQKQEKRVGSLLQLAFEAA